MGINVANANARANELRAYATQLRSAKGNLSQYKGIFGSSWQGTEITYYVNAVGNVETKLIQAATELDAIANSIVATANQIRAEEEAAERARREAEERARQEALAAAAAAAASKAAQTKKSLN